MKQNLIKQTGLLLSLMAATAMTTAVSAQAQTATDMDELLSSEQEFTTETQPFSLDEATPMASSQTGEPVPGTVSTSAQALLQPQWVDSTEFTTLPESEFSDTTVAQQNIRPGRATQAGRSYVGAGVNIGIGGDTALGETSFAVMGKIGLTNTFSVRPSVILGDDTAFLIPVTYDFQLRQSDPFEQVRFAPYAGGGLIVTTDEDDNLGFLLTGGVDVPFSEQFTANAAVNLGFIEDETELGLTIGVGYQFPGF